ncbi:MAG: ATP-grasp domain-containing protein [Treponema sp.]|nr:ATP-grasp domain-containing protein [Treponema sp.]
MQERIIILGAGVMQGPAIRIAQELGLYAVVVDGSSSAPCIAMADRFEHIDLKDKEGIEAFARSLQSSGGLEGIMTAGTDFSATVAWVAERLGLPGIPYEAALNASDKSRMRACFKKAGVPSPEFITITAEDSFPNINARRHGGTEFWENNLTFPLVVKPVDNMGGRGCRRVNSMEELGDAAVDSLRFSRSGRAIVEAFMPGPEFSVDAIVYRGEIMICGLADRHIFFPPFFIEMGHTMPTNFPPLQQRALLTAFCDGVRALGLAGRDSVGAAKGDIKLTPQGEGAEAPMIGEIAARLSGGYMSGWTYPYSSGAQPIRAAILAAMGRKPDGIAPQKDWTSAERAFISIPGTVRAVTGVEAARETPHVHDLFFRAAPGDKVQFPVNNVSKCGNVISAAPGRAAAVEAAEAAARSILIRLDPADEETASFLSASSAFPPSAFQLTAELQAELDALPETSISNFISRRHGGTEEGGLSANGAYPTLSPDIREISKEVEEPSDENSVPQCLCVDHTEASLALYPFPAFIKSGLKDYVGRSVQESLEAVRSLTGLSLPEFTVENTESSDNKGRYLGKGFWAALARGGYQGAVYYIDRYKLF